MGDYRLDELGRLGFERLCEQVLALGCGVGADRWKGGGSEARWLYVPDGLSLPFGGPELAGAVVVQVFFRGAHGERRARNMAWRVLDALERLRPTTLVMLTDGEPDHSAEPASLGRVFDVSGTRVVVLGPAELSALIRAQPALRLAMPSLLGLSGAAGPAPVDDAAHPGTLDLAAARRLARVFVPTRPYARAVQTLLRHHVAVLTGPPEMGKTAIARMVALAKAGDGWDAYECRRPEELWAAHRPERSQVFVADDAFGTTGYGTEGAERWARELGRVLAAMDERHWLVCTSRPAPLRAALRRVHREGASARFPAPGEVEVDAAALDDEDRACVLFRHAQAAGLDAAGVAVVRAHAEAIVRHPHVTPERIRRFVGTRLPALAEGAPVPHLDAAAVVEEDLEAPTVAMTSSLDALPAPHRAVLVAMLDTPAGPVPERQLAAALRRHRPELLTRAPSELVSDLADHFVRLAPLGVAWMHPTWRDLVIDRLADDPRARGSFLAACGIEGALVSISTAGGLAGERRLPLLRDDADWDRLAEGLDELVAEASDADVTRLVRALVGACETDLDRAPEAEVLALAGRVLEAARARLDAAPVPIPLDLLEAWLDLLHLSCAPVRLPAVGPSWVELLPPLPFADPSADDLRRLLDWLWLARLLDRHAPAELAALGFPRRHRARIDGVLAAAGWEVSSTLDPERRRLLYDAVDQLGQLTPGLAGRVSWLEGNLGPPAERVVEDAERWESYHAAASAPLEPAVDVQGILRDL